MFGLGPWELIIIGILLFVLFGAKRIPEIGKGLGGAVREFRGVKRDLSAGNGDSGTPEQSPQNEGVKADNALESKMAGKALNQIPGVRRAMQVKEKVDRVRKAVE